RSKKAQQNVVNAQQVLKKIRSVDRLRALSRWSMERTSGSLRPEIAVDPPVRLDLLDVVVGFLERDVFGEDVRVGSTWSGPAVYVAVTGVVAGQGPGDLDIAFQALAEIVRAELDVFFGLIQVFLLEVRDLQRACYFQS